MNSAAMKHYEGLIQSTVHNLLEAFNRRQGEKIDISMWMTAYGCVTYTLPQFEDEADHAAAQV